MNAATTVEIALAFCAKRSATDALIRRMGILLIPKSYVMPRELTARMAERKELTMTPDIWRMLFFILLGIVLGNLFERWRFK